jgi:hypothetical protein
MYMSKTSNNIKTMQERESIFSLDALQVHITLRAGSMSANPLEGVISTIKEETLKIADPLFAKKGTPVFVPISSALAAVGISEMWVCLKDGKEELGNSICYRFARGPYRGRHHAF